MRVSIQNQSFLLKIIHFYAKTSSIFLTPNLKDNKKSCTLLASQLSFHYLRNSFCADGKINEQTNPIIAKINIMIKPKR